MTDSKARRTKKGWDGLEFLYFLRQQKWGSCRSCGPVGAACSCCCPAQPRRRSSIRVLMDEGSRRIRTASLRPATPRPAAAVHATRGPPGRRCQPALDDSMPAPGVGQPGRERTPRDRQRRRTRVEFQVAGLRTRPELRPPVARPPRLRALCSGRRARQAAGRQPRPRARDTAGHPAPLR